MTGTKILKRIRLYSLALKIQSMIDGTGKP